MELNSTGPISLGNVCNGKGISLSTSLGTLSTTNINTLSVAKPNGIAPHSISEFYSYNHNATAPSIVITGYSAGYLYFTVSGSGYSPSSLTVRTSTTSANGPWTNNSGSPLSPRNISTPSTTSWYQVLDQSNSSIASNIYLVSTADTTAPSIPSGLYCEYGANPQSSISVEWGSSTDNIGVSGYQLQRKTSTTSIWTTRYSGPNTYYADTGVRNTLYNYKVRAFDAAGNYSNFSPITSWMTDEAPITCLVEGTLITLPNGDQKPIETLGINELLLSSEIATLVDTNNVNELYKWSSNYLIESRITAPITKIESKISYETIVLNNGLLEATPQHSQLIQRDGIWKFLPIGDVIVGDNLYGIDKQIIPVTSAFRSFEKRHTYPMSLNPSHTYFANGILTHNIKPLDP